MILSVDDGCASDMRLANLADKYGIETVFYWPVEWHSLAYDKGYEPLDYIDARAIASAFEIGSHTITHRHLTRIPLQDALQEIRDSKIMLEAMFGREITKFCPPRGYTDGQLTDMTMANYKSQRLTRGQGLVHIHPNSGANDNKPWLDCVNDDTQEIWCHSWELDKYDLWAELEEFLGGR